MSATSAPVAARTALLLAGRPEAAELEGLMRGLGYLPTAIGGADDVGGVLEGVALCLVDLRQNGEALRTARAVRARRIVGSNQGSKAHQMAQGKLTQRTESAEKHGIIGCNVCEGVSKLAEKGAGVQGI